MAPSAKSKKIEKPGEAMKAWSEEAVSRLRDARAQKTDAEKDLQEAYGEAMLELRARKKLAALMEREDDK